MDFLIILQAFWIIIPAYIANGLAVLVGGGRPIDSKKTWKDGKRILGDGKTWKGLIIGTLLGMIAGFGLVIAAVYISFSEYSYLDFTDFGRFPLMIPILFSICFGALLGDIIESFFKRRLGKERGEDWILFDQIDFILGAMFFSFIAASFLNILGCTSENWFLNNLFPWKILILLIVTPFIHITANYIHSKKIASNKKE